jgi:hypothetical protein
MASDFSRKTFYQQKHYSGVLMQQGRVQLDADWNEQLDIDQYRTKTQAIDVIGKCGVPQNGGNFRITLLNGGRDLGIAAGRIYIGGLLFELDGAASYFNQPYLPKPDASYFNQPPASPLSSPPVPPLQDGTYIVYIDGWQREVNYLDDPRIREVALGDADTATRLQNVWQVRLLQVDDRQIGCKSEVAQWTTLTQASTGRLAAQTKPVQDPKNPCLLPPSAGYQRLENQLYRVEIQKGGTEATASFKWSRDNATVETEVADVDPGGLVLTVSGFGRDETLGFAGDQWVEVVEEEWTLKNDPRPLVQIDSISPSASTITLKTPIGTEKIKRKLRRWDQSVAAAGPDGLPLSTAWVGLEDGIEVQFLPGTYRAGDYWLIPARTATGQIEWPLSGAPNNAPVFEPPVGVQHYYCRLAIVRVQGGVVAAPEDCRPLFPPLTELDLNADLRWHHKHLHGFGVVCGLKVKCRVGREGVIIESGHALDCEGNRITVAQQNGLAYDLVPVARSLGLLDEKESGRVCLSIAAGGNGLPVISLEPFVAESFWDTVLEGTLLKDFYDQCIDNLIRFLRQQFPFPMTDEAPVPVEQRRLTSVLNLLAQLVNSASGQYGFLSGRYETPGRRSEDDLLRQLYIDLKALLASETFCAMNDNDTPYPDYTLERGLSTVFGPALKMHTRLRLHPTGRFAYTVGGNNRVYVYNLETEELIQTIPFDGPADIVLQDIALSENRIDIYAVGIVNSVDSIFGLGRIANTGHITWTGTSSVPGVRYVSLGLRFTDQLFAVAKAAGLHQIAGIGTANFSNAVFEAFNATGLLCITNERTHISRPNIILAAATTGSGDSPTFDHVLHFMTNANGTSGLIIEAQGVDASNDITVHKNVIYISGDNPTTPGARMVGAYDLLSGRLEKIANVENTVIRLAGYLDNARDRDVLMLSYSDYLKVVCIDLSNEAFEVDRNFRIPTQWFPIAVVTDHKLRRGYVLNPFVNTLTAMQLQRVFRASPAPDYTMEPPMELADYRHQAVRAYRDLFSHFLQYLKDCFCDKFLIDCPTCDEDDKVYLACIEVRGGRVYHICNFSKRRYVKSFRTVEYWLSTIPLLPILRQAFTMFCCQVFDTPRTVTVEKQDTATPGNLN